MGKLQINFDRTRVWKDEAGRFHRLDGPAVEYVDGRKIWYINGVMHRSDGPGIESGTSRVWYEHGRYLEMSKSWGQFFSEVCKKTALLIHMMCKERFCLRSDYV